MTSIYLLKDKTEVKEMFKTFHKMVQTQFQENIKIIKTNDGREYYNTILGDLFLENDLLHQSSCYDTSQLNRVAERKNRDIC